MLRWQKIPQRAKGILIAVPIIAMAILVRRAALGALGSRVAWVTFYPGVVIAAVYGGLYAGVVATILSCVAVVFLWSWFNDAAFITGLPDVLGMVVFFLNCLLISFVGESRQRAVARALRAQERAETANHAKSTFLAAMSHELRTPLNAVLGFCRLMLTDATLSAENRRHLGIIDRNGEHLLRLINSVLEMTRIETGKATLEVTPFDPGGMMRDVADLMQERAATRDVQLHFHHSPTIPQHVRGDVVKIRQVLINLIANAIKFTDRGGRVTVSQAATTSDTPETIWLEFTIEDTGIGIAPEHLNHIFDAFYQVGGQSDTAREGTGLGLTISKQFIDLMKGQISVTSTPGKGSMFHIRVPLLLTHASELMDTGTEANNATQLATLAAGQSTFRILVVDDAPDNLLLLRQLLERVGFTVATAENGIRAVEAFRKWKPDFVWMDRRMPEMDGLEATRVIRKLPDGERVKIVALTASAFASERDEMLRAGMDDFVRKPFQQKEILDTLARHLGVRYNIRTADYGKTDSAVLTSSAASAPTFAGLSTLPDDLRQSLRDALIRLDVERIRGVVHDITAVDRSLGEQLAQRTQQFSYGSVLEALTAQQEASRVR